MTPEQEQIRELARDFAQGELRPHAEEWDREAAFPREVIGKLGELGFLGMILPEEWDGLGLDATTYLIALEEIARGDASVAVAMSVHNSLPTQMILASGTPEQKERWLKPMARGELLGGFALSEADAGSDAARLSAQARKVDGGWVLNGAKAWITNGGFGDVMVAMARTDTPEDRRGAKGIGAFIVPTDTEGYSVGKKEDKMGQRASETVGIAFHEMFVPDDQLLGDPSMGFVYALQGLDSGRMGIAALAVGIAQAALEHAVRYGGERKQFGTPVRDFQGMQFKMANMATRIEAARALLMRAAAAKDAGQPVRGLASMAKLFASETAMYVTTEAVQVHGGYGYVKEYPVERLFRDAKVTEIYEGTSEIQRTVIARELYRAAGPS
ncbi:MAG TPA: acyl-CoA dehydrogenase family protein [Longimicrobiaceae bacterium]|jgi:alkylation response protein AidB-like acyl-CoA dehydrogenase|nr:acyl-CoA dehydrogenase family protein [Longimicrobiaceae bacterium]